MTKLRLTLRSMIGRLNICAALLRTTTAAVSCAIGATATLANDFYAGKTITLAVGFTAGGGNDANARLLARHFGRHLPGAPTIIVQNMPGAASAKPVMFLDSGAPKDGTMIATFGNGIILLSLLDPEKMKVNLSKVAWIGSINREDGVCFSWAATGFKSWDDFFSPTKRFNVGASAPGSNVYNATAILKNMFHTNAHIIMGYPGSAEKRIAIENGELDGDCGSWTSVPLDWLRDKKIVPLVRFSSYSAPDMPPMPYIADFAKSEKDKQILNFLLASGEVGRPYVASLSVPAERLALLRQAFDATMTDPAFLVESQKLNLPISVVSGTDAAKLIDAIYEASPDIVAAAREIVK